MGENTESIVSGILEVAGDIDVPVCDRMQSMELIALVAASKADELLQECGEPTGFDTGEILQGRRVSITVTNPPE